MRNNHLPPGEFQKPPAPKRSEWELIVEFIGVRNLLAVGALGGLYFVSGYTNVRNGLSVFEAFNPYHALRLQEGAELLVAAGDAFIDGLLNFWGMIAGFLARRAQEARNAFEANVVPFIHSNPVTSLIVCIAIGFASSIGLLLAAIWILRRLIALVPTAGVVGGRTATSIKEEEVWKYDPRKRPSDDYLKRIGINLERLVQRAPAMSGIVPKDADHTIREIALRNRDTEYVFRYAIYVMGPIKGTSYDNACDLPLTFDQLRRLTRTLGDAAEYENLPIDLVMLRAPKSDRKFWSLETGVSPIKCGNSYPIGMVETVVAKYRNHFLWDGRGKKSHTGYGTTKRPLETDLLPDIE